MLQLRTYWDECGIYGPLVIHFNCTMHIHNSFTLIYIEICIYITKKTKYIYISMKSKHNLEQKYAFYYIISFTLKVYV